MINTLLDSDYKEIIEGVHGEAFVGALKASGWYTYSRVLNSEYKEIEDGSLIILDVEDSIYADSYVLKDGGSVTKKIHWSELEGFKAYLKLSYAVLTLIDGTDLLVKIDKGVRDKNYVDVTIRRLNESESLEASTWLESKLPKYDMFDIKPPFETV